MAFYKGFQTNSNKIPITKEEARVMIADYYGEKSASRHMDFLLKYQMFSIGYWNLFYEPTMDTYCSDQGCESEPVKCGYFPRQCMAWKYGRK